VIFSSQPDLYNIALLLLLCYKMISIVQGPQFYNQQVQSLYLYWSIFLVYSSVLSVLNTFIQTSLASVYILLGGALLFLVVVQFQSKQVVRLRIGNQNDLMDLVLRLIYLIEHQVSVF